MPLQQLPTIGLDDPNHRRRHREITNSILTHQFDDSKVRTPAEIAAGVTPVNYAYAPGNWLRYGADPTGVSDSTTAIRNSIKAAGQLGYRGVSYGPAGIYEITGSIAPGVSGTTVQTIICGDGPSTQVVNAASAGTASFNGSGVSGWKLRDIAFTGNSANPNNGILLDGAAGTTIDWVCERVTVAMPGYGFKLKDTNTGVIRSCRSWPSGENWNVTPVVTDSDIDHHIYMTGGFVHDLSVYDFMGLPLSTYKANQAGLHCDATSSIGLRVIGGVWQCDNNSRYAFSVANLRTFFFLAPYIENALMAFAGCVNGVVSCAGAGGVGGSLELSSSTQDCTFMGVQAALFSADSGSNFNTLTGCSFPTSFTDSAVPKNRFDSCAILAARYVDLGARPRVRVTQTGGGTLTIDAALTSIYEIVVSDATAFTIAAPTHPYDGMLLDITVFNNTVGAIGAITFNAAFIKPTFTNPATSKSRTLQFYYDSTGSVWRYRSGSTVDIP